MPPRKIPEGKPIRFGYNMDGTRVTVKQYLAFFGVLVLVWAPLLWILSNGYAEYLGRNSPDKLALIAAVNMVVGISILGFVTNRWIAKKPRGPGYGFAGEYDPIGRWMLRTIRRIRGQSD